MPETKYIRAAASESQREIRAYRKALLDAIIYIQFEILDLRFCEKKEALPRLRHALRTRGGTKRGGPKNG